MVTAQRLPFTRKRKPVLALPLHIDCSGVVAPFSAHDFFPPFFFWIQPRIAFSSLSEPPSTREASPAAGHPRFTVFQVAHFRFAAQRAMQGRDGQASASAMVSGLSLATSSRGRKFAGAKCRLAGWPRRRQQQMIPNRKAR